jgi:predicted DNA-binding transcriptional regulator AlpA
MDASRRELFSCKSQFPGTILARRVAAVAFPRPMRIGKRRVARVQSEVSDWLAARAEERGSIRLAEPTSTNEALQKGKAI